MVMTLADSWLVSVFSKGFEYNELCGFRRMELSWPLLKLTVSLQYLLDMPSTIMLRFDCLELGGGAFWLRLPAGWLKCSKTRKVHLFQGVGTFVSRRYTCQRSGLCHALCFVDMCASMLCFFCFLTALQELLTLNTHEIFDQSTDNPHVHKQKQNKDSHNKT